jgi:mono/diheme cytochrome c family protein
MNLRAYLVVLLGSLVALAAAAVAPSRAAVAAGDEAALERGRYLVQQVGMCVNCHGSGLKGAKLDFLAADLPAAHFAPRIAGLPHLTASQAVTYLQVGLLPNGTRSRPPMPQYRLHHDDAVAVVTYLKQLR